MLGVRRTGGVPDTWRVRRLTAAVGHEVTRHTRTQQQLLLRNHGGDLREYIGVQLGKGREVDLQAWRPGTAGGVAGLSRHASETGRGRQHARDCKPARGLLQLSARHAHVRRDHHATHRWPPSRRRKTPCCSAGPAPAAPQARRRPRCPAAPWTCRPGHAQRAPAAPTDEGVVVVCERCRQVAQAGGDKNVADSSRASGVWHAKLRKGPAVWRTSGRVCWDAWQAAARRALDLRKSKSSNTCARKRWRYLVGCRGRRAGTRQYTSPRRGMLSTSCLAEIEHHCFRQAETCSQQSGMQGWPPLAVAPALAAAALAAA